MAEGVSIEFLAAEPEPLPDQQSGAAQASSEPRELFRVQAAAAGELPAAVTGNRGGEHTLALEQRAAGGGLAGCLACGHPELYTQKDVNRALGIAVVVVAAVLAPFTHYISLFVAAAIDFVLYRTAGDVVCCYACDARHRGFPTDPHHPHFDREIEERLLYGKKAVMGKPMREGGTAGAPEPEH